MMWSLKRGLGLDYGEVGFSNVSSLTFPSIALYVNDYSSKFYVTQIFNSSTLDYIEKATEL